MLGFRESIGSQNFNQLTAHQEANYVSNPLNLLDAVRNHYGRQSLSLLQLHYHVLDVLGRNWVQCTRRLIQQKNLFFEKKAPLGIDCEV